jgi:molecular chaperone Hsp33
MEESTSQLIRALAARRTVRVLSVDMTAVALAMCSAHKLAGPAAQLAAEGLVATALMAGQIKGEERLSLQMRFDNFSGSFMGEIDAENNVRAMMRPARLKWRQGEVLQGAVMAMKHNAEKELYRGVTHLDHVSIEHALVDHLETSNQLDVLVRIGCEMGDDARPSWVGGVVVERLPQPDGEDTQWFSERFGALRDMTLPKGLSRLQDGDLLGEEMDILQIWKVRWRCRCSLEKVRATLLSMGSETLRGLQVDPGYAGVTCHFCNHTYTLADKELQELIEMSV